MSVVISLSFLRIVSYNEFKKATESDLAPMRVHEGTIASLHEHELKMWEDLKVQFMEPLDEVQAELEAADLPKPPLAHAFNVIELDFSCDRFDLE
ncbi:hypothetical protein E4T56_gene20513 [Termitomyces sp. T112]|nr:hypothetical protein E4T56_gene20513 [Termitomyces sp. T112]